MAVLGGLVLAAILAAKTARALRITRHQKPTALVVAGGVAANLALRAALIATATDYGLSLIAPPVTLCTDNGVMIAWAGLEHLRLGMTDGLDVAARPRWPLAQ